MSTRERWIIYPLLFMTLGIALRDKVIPPASLGNAALHVRANSVQCAELQAGRVFCGEVDVVNGDGQRIAFLGAESGSQTGKIEILNRRGVPQVRLMATDLGGIVAATARAGRAALVLGDTGNNLGLSLEVPQVGYPIPVVSVPSRIETKRPPTPPKGENEKETPPTEKSAEKAAEGSPEKDAPP